MEFLSEITNEKKDKTVAKNFTTSTSQLPESHNNLYLCEMNGEPLYVS